MKKIGFVDLFIDEWHSNHLPEWISQAVRKDEFELAKSMGYKTVYLGKRILRAETASIALLGIIMYSLEELK